MATLSDPALFRGREGAGLFASLRLPPFEHTKEETGVVHLEKAGDQIAKLARGVLVMVPAARSLSPQQDSPLVFERDLRPVAKWLSDNSIRVQPLAVGVQHNNGQTSVLTQTFKSLGPVSFAVTSLCSRRAAEETRLEKLGISVGIVGSPAYMEYFVERGGEVNGKIIRNGQEFQHIDRAFVAVGERHADGTVYPKGPKPMDVLCLFLDAIERSSLQVSPVDALSSFGFPSQFARMLARA